MLGKNGLNIRIEREKIHQNYEFFFSGFEKVLKMHGSVIFALPALSTHHTHCCTRFRIKLRKEMTRWNATFFHAYHFSDVLARLTAIKHR